ncbi:hypothetical protein CGMCC3_g15825 [Colletotrichum fructicola]|uniref:Uncharacterized protein n=1 Tax=Colletotrichum fructicola (strain Nara gc5) TaxID=1213859 RepID=L2GF42_COLFN|nr:uncharacterized protein CGMCC3_g15825 [Colletotrichum fructicola]KAE9568033.1 hypothetical protein CGMCC3_g15825 [Colletotrichum fructicola]KAF4474153.1 hypothetical protein CGGC5_v016925 [Colletotrichum fructicola Nara gc5]
MTIRSLSQEEAAAARRFLDAIFSCSEANDTGFALLGKDLEGLLAYGNKPSYVALRPLVFFDNHSHYGLHECLKSPDGDFDGQTRDYVVGGVTINISGCVTEHGSTMVTNFDRLFRRDTSTLTTVVLTHVQRQFFVQVMDVRNHIGSWRSTYHVPLNVRASHGPEGYVTWDITLIKSGKDLEDGLEAMEICDMP